jgi:hypothetical protein
MEECTPDDLFTDHEVRKQDRPAFPASMCAFPATVIELSPFLCII